MPIIKYKNQQYQCRATETVLDALMRQGVEIPFSCRNGICQVCLQRCVAGDVPAGAQKGIRPALAALGYFLPCRCSPPTDLEFAPPRAEDLYVPALVHEKEFLTSDVCRLLLEPSGAFRYRAGQFINVRRADGLVRSYSLASVPDDDYFLELHVKRMPNGAMSNWIFETLQTGDELQIQGPEGYTSYAGGDPSENLLLIGSGTGLAPLLGIVRDALRCGHTGGIHLFHGARESSELYFRNLLLAMCGDFPNFRYTACTRNASASPGVLQGQVHEIALALHPDLRDWRLYLAGPEPVVRAGNELALRAGVQRDRIHADPFAYKELRKSVNPRTTASVNRHGSITVHERGRRPEPDPEMWAALDEGERLTAILTEFYDRVFLDARLSPYFHGLTKQRLIEKVYSFMRQLFTGEKIFFGDRPRNAHHWMVISDDLFDHRLSLMVSILKRHGLPEHLVRRWRDIEEGFRPDIVKSEPWIKVMAGVEMPLDGYGEMTVTVGTLCDGCSGEIQPGETVRYHLRIGTTYCAHCATPSTRTATGSR